MGPIKYLGILTAAIWAGATLFFTVIVGPAFFSADMLALFGGNQNLPVARYYAGSVAQIILERYFWIQIICGMLAMLLLMLEWIATGRPIRQMTLYLVLGLFSLVLIGAYGIQPKLHRLHRTMYALGNTVTLDQTQQARKMFGWWHGVSQALNVIVLGGTLVYLWQVSQPPPSIKFANRVSSPFSRP